MSDGPHRTLPMRQHWKELAKRAAKAAFAADEVCEALPVALKRDFFVEAPLDEVREILCGGDQPLLFNEEAAQRLEGLRQSNCSAVGNILIDCAIDAVGNGQSGDAAYDAALKSALDEHTRGAFRQMEEHYLQEGSARNARFLRERLDAARNQTNFETIASDISTQGRQPISSLQLQKRTGLDEGPPL